MDEGKSKEDLYNEARAIHRSLDEQVQALQAKPFLTAEEEAEVKRLKIKKLHYKDLMEQLKEQMKTVS